MSEKKYCQIINRFTNKIIASGKIINCKEIPVKCITFDNRYFFNLNSLFYKFNFCDECGEIKFDYIKYKNKIRPWRESIKKKHCLVYREYDINELDEEVECLVHAINEIDIRTVGSCSGHDKSYAWIDICFEDFYSLKKFINILDKDEFRKKFILTTDAHIINSNKKDIYLSLKTIDKGKKAYQDIEELANYLRKIF